MIKRVTEITPAQAAGLVRYCEHHIRPGSFLQAVISNDLRGAIEAADDTNIQIIPLYVKWLYWNAPPQCWGSKEKMENWIIKPQGEQENG